MSKDRIYAVLMEERMRRMREDERSLAEQRRTVNVYFAFSDTNVAIAKILSEEAMNEATRARCGCHIACLVELQRKDTLRYNNVL